MTNDLDEAIEDAKRMADSLKAMTPSDAAAESRQTVYVFEGCDCLDQGGTEFRYHIHRFNRAGYELWWATRENLQVVAQFPGWQEAAQ